MKSYSIEVNEYTNGGFVAKYTWFVEEEDEDGREDTYRESCECAYGNEDDLVRDVVQFLTETGDWADEDDPEAEKAATKFLQR